MADAVEKALSDGIHLIVEAGTGVGKSLAYLVPLIQFARNGNCRAVVATYTKALQQQLVESGMWGLNLLISWSIQNQEHLLHFFKDEAYASKDEAEAICIDYGKLIIDREIPGASVG